ncbi:MAG: serine hydrolase [Candidatus Aminicenantes bacterium]|nr:serine hydrolase [Candidatus Aminicenantes bacterium]
MQVMKSHELPGLAIGIVKDNEIVYAKGFGVKNIDTKEPVTTKSLFHMASVSKPFSATAIMQLVEQGKVSLDDPVVKYLPYFKVNDKRYKEITIRQMLGHISGMPDVNDYHWDKPEYDDGALERYVRSLTDEELIAAPGERFSYSNMAFEVLGDLIAKVSGVSFEDYVKKNILDPLGMHESTFLKKKVSPKLATTPHVMKLKTVVSDIYPYHRAHAPSSTLHSNVLEMCNWAMANMNKGAFKGKKILKPESYDILWKPAKLNNGETGRAGLSWFLRTYREIKTVSHGGGDVGYRTYFIMMPERSTAAVVLSNCDFAPTGDITIAALLTILGLEPPSLPKAPIRAIISKTIAEKGTEAAIKQYKELKENHPKSYDFSPRQLNRLGYDLLRMERVKDAIEIFKLNIEVYPKNANCHDSLGEAYMTDGDKQNAIIYYEKALELDPTMESAIKALRKLREKD